MATLEPKKPRKAKTMHYVATFTADTGKLEEHKYVLRREAKMLMMQYLQGKYRSIYACADEEEASL